MTTTDYVLLVEWAVRLGMAAVVISRKRSLYPALSWLVVVAFVPFVGAAAYLLVGELRLGRRKSQAHLATRKNAGLWNAVQGRIRHVLQPPIPERLRSIAVLGEGQGGSPPLGGNDLLLLSDAGEVADRLITEIDASRRHCHLCYFIIQVDDVAGRVGDALLRARARGVKCRVLADAVGSKTFLRGPLARRLVAYGVHVAAALPVHPLRAAVWRMDLRNHRKLAVIDGLIAFTGSHNLCGPIYPRKAKYGAWVDATVRVIGPAVHFLQEVFLEDWLFTTGELCDADEHFAATEVSSGPNFALQVLPSGPDSPESPLVDVIAQALRLAQSRATFTTPYFVPDDETVSALRSAALRGVEVNVVVPRKSDHGIAQAAGRSHYGYLMEMGVRIHEYEGGLIHSKTLTVDEDFAMIGTGNLDVRSFLLNFELSLLVYDPEFTARLHFLQSSYIEKSTRLTPAQWKSRGALKSLGDNVAKLLTPLL